MTELTSILSQAEHDRCGASERLLPIVYDELRLLAAHRLAQEQPGQTLQATALVHEAWLRLVRTDASIHWESKAHFFGAAAEAMRRILIDRARQKNAKKRSATREQADMDKIVETPWESPLDELLDLDDAITRLTEDDSTSGEFVKLRIYAGLSVEEAAASLNMSARTGYRTWAFAKAWLYRDLRKDES